MLTCGFWQYLKIFYTLLRCHVETYWATKSEQNGLGGLYSCGPKLMWRYPTLTSSQSTPPPTSSYGRYASTTMSTELKFWCKSFINMYYFINYFSDCANNFLNCQHRPHNGDFLRFEIWKSDTLFEVTGVAFVFSEDFYVRWIAEGQKIFLLEHLQSKERFKNSAEGMKHFWWKHKNSNCAESTLHL